MKNMIARFLREEDGQDLVEYSLLLAFVCLGAAALFVGAGNQVFSIWTIANKYLTNANTAAVS